LWFQSAHLAPDFITCGVKINKRGRIFKTVKRRQFAADVFLYIEADEMYLIAKFFFEPVNDGFYRGTANSIRRLELKQNGRACPDHFLHYFGIVHERRLTRMHDDPGGEQACDDHAEGEEIIPFWFACEQY